MPTYQADAVVLRRLDYGEADRILTLLTREHGKLAAIAKGSRRAKARSGSSLDLFARSQMMLAKGRNLDVVAQAQRRGDVRHISGDLRRTAYAGLVAEVADKVLCASCGEALPEAAAWFSPLLGGVLCRKCGAHDQAGSPVSVTGLKVLRVMAVGDSALYDRLRLSPELLVEVEAALEAQLEYHLDRRLKSLEFIRTIR